MSDVEAVCLTIPLRSDVMKNRTPEEMVRSALARGKIGPDQEKWAMEYATRDPKGFEVFGNKAVAIPPATPAKDKEKEIDETQRMINALFGIDDETFKKYGPGDAQAGAGEDADDTQRIINRLFGIEEPRRGADAKDLDDTQRHINRLCGVDDETFLKHGG
jgi:hypothetical protein